MKKTLLLLLLYSGFAYSQVEVSMGYVVPINDDYGKGYLSVGHDGIGGIIYIGGDSRISYGDENDGRGFVGLEGYMNVLRSERTDWRIIPSAGIQMNQYYNAILDAGRSRKRPIYDYSTYSYTGTLKVGWKMLEIGYTTNNEVLGGFLLSF